MSDNKYLSTFNVSLIDALNAYVCIRQQDDYSFDPWIIYDDSASDDVKQYKEILLKFGENIYENMNNADLLQLGRQSDKIYIPYTKVIVRKKCSCFECHERKNTHNYFSPTMIVIDSNIKKNQITLLDILDAGRCLCNYIENTSHGEKINHFSIVNETNDEIVLNIHYDFY
jgi:hypothetical protein